MVLGGRCPIFKVLVVFASALMASVANAGDCKVPSDECVAIGGWNFSLALGGGVRTNPLEDGKDIPLVLIPHVSFYGRRFFLDDLDLGFTLTETNTSTLSIVASPGYDRVFFYRSDLQNFFVAGVSTATTGTTVPTGTGSNPPAVQFPARSRRIAYLAGPEWTFQYRGATGQLDVLQTITGQNGQEVRGALGIPVPFLTGKLTANIGFTWKSSSVVNYYYGASHIYEGGSALDPFLKLGYTLPAAGRWHFNAFVEYERLGSAIANSPIVAEHHVATVFAGAVYTF